MKRTNRDIRTAVILGSTREGRLCTTVADWTAARILAHGGLALDIIDPAAIPSLPVVHQAEDGAAVQELQRRIAQADAFVVVTPEYNHSFPAALKFVIDSVHAPWRAKPVGFVSYGGGSAGFRAVEQLRQVFAELHAVTVRNSVGFSNVWERFDADGQLREPERAQRSMAKMLDQLAWWAHALRAARAADPYDRIAA